MDTPLNTISGSHFVFLGLQKSQKLAKQCSKVNTDLSKSRERKPRNLQDLCLPYCTILLQILAFEGQQIGF